MNNKQLEFLKSREYLTKHEIKDLLDGWTSVNTLLDPDDKDLFDVLGCIDEETTNE